MKRFFAWGILLISFCFIGKAFASPIPVCVVGDALDVCDCKSRGRSPFNQRDEKIFNACVRDLEQKKQEEYLNSPEYKQQQLEEAQRDLEAKQRELEAKQAQLEMELARAEYMNTVEKAKNSLGKRAQAVEMVADKILEKGQDDVDKILVILERFIDNKNEEIKNIGIYLTYLLE